MTVNKPIECRQAEGINDIRLLKPGCRILCETTGHQEESYILLRLLLQALDPRVVISSVLPNLEYCEIIKKSVSFAFPKHPVVSWKDAVETTQKINDKKRHILVFYDFTQDFSTTTTAVDMQSLPDIFVTSPNISLVLFMPPPVVCPGGLQFCLRKTDDNFFWETEPVQTPTPWVDALQPGCRAANGKFQSKL